MALKLVYIAGPYTAPTRCQVMANIQRAREVADRVARAGAFPVWPHPLGAGLEDAGDEAFWYAGTLELMRRCDAVVLVPGWEKSKGAQGEAGVADIRDMPLFCVADEWDHFLRWLDAHRVSP